MLNTRLLRVDSRFGEFLRNVRFEARCGPAPRQHAGRDPLAGDVLGVPRGSTRRTRYPTPWRMLAKVIEGVPLDAEELAAFGQLAGHAEPPIGGVEECS